MYDEPESPNKGAACLRYMMNRNPPDDGACLTCMMNRKKTVFERYDEPELPNDGACLGYMMHRSRQNRGARHVYAEPNHQTRAGVQDVMNRQSVSKLGGGGRGGAAPPQSPRFRKPCERALVNLEPSRTLFRHLRCQLKHISRMRPCKARPRGPTLLRSFFCRASLF